MQVDPARRVAFAALVQVEVEGAYLNLVLPGLLTEAGVEGRDRAFATELAHGTARLQGRYDAILETLVKGGVAGLQPEVVVALRLGVHQLVDMRVPDHAAVGTSVELVRMAVGERPVRLVNAVLRAVSRQSLDEWMAEVAPSPDADPIGRLAVTQAHPRWVVEEFDKRLPDRDSLLQLLHADNEAPAVTLVVRPGLAEVPELLQGGADAGRWSPYAAVLPGGDPGALAAVREARAGVQDEGSQLAALALARAEVAGRDERWLDLCAGPGGKAALLAGLARQRGATLVAVERAPHRSRLVRLGLRGYPDGYAVVTGDGTRPPFASGAFDRVLVDVPCTGLGALRRRPEARWRRTPEDLRPLVPLQEALLESAVRLVRPGGVVAYVTCSPVLAETRSVVDAVCARLRAVPDAADSAAVEATEISAVELLPEVPGLEPGPSVQLWPHLHGTDAMFVSLLRRAG
jgi:16S rRNA (cytosine967-C5)-methyltransferase